MCGFTSSCTCAISSGHLLFIQTLYCIQWRPWSDCADAQADLGLRCPYMPEERFRMAHMTIHNSIWSTTAVIVIRMIWGVCLKWILFESPMGLNINLGWSEACDMTIFLSLFPKKTCLIYLNLIYIWTVAKEEIGILNADVTCRVAAVKHKKTW